MTQNVGLPELDDEDEADSGPTLPPPKMSIKVSSQDVLQTTITKSCLEVLGNLGKVQNNSYIIVISGLDLLIVLMPIRNSQLE